MIKNMSNKSNSEQNWLSSTKIKSLLKISACELMHRRVSGELEFKKVGNAYLYKWHK